MTTLTQDISELANVIASHNVPCFNGKNYDRWIHKFELYCKKCYIDEGQRTNEVKFFLEDRAAAWHDQLDKTLTWREWKLKAADRFNGGIEATAEKIRALHVDAFRSTDEFMEELRLLIMEYKNLSIGTSVTLESLKSRVHFQEAEGISIAMSTLDADYCRFINYHAPKDLEELYKLIKRHGRFTNRGRQFPATFEVTTKKNMKVIMPPPEDDGMKALAKEIK